MILFRVVITAALLSIQYFNIVTQIRYQTKLNRSLTVLATLGQIVGSVLFIKETGFEGATACVISGFLILGKHNTNLPFLNIL